MSSIPWGESASEPTVRVGLDAEALWWEDKGSVPWSRLGLCWSYGTLGDIRTVEAEAPGVFDLDELEEMVDVLTAPNVIVVGHNVRRYDLELLQGTLRRRLPTFRTQDTMNDLKTGRSYRNTLKAQCSYYDIQLKGDSPDWRLIIEGDREEWQRMVEYCENDVTCALELERALAVDGLAVPIKAWRGQKAA